MPLSRLTGSCVRPVRAVVLVALVAAASTLAIPRPAAALPGTLSLPFPPGETWYVCQGYDGPVTHRGATATALDLTVAADAAVTGGCSLTSATASTGRRVTAPANGTIAAVGPEVACLEVDGGGSVVLGHLAPSVTRGQRVSAGSELGTLHPPGVGGNGGYAHLHIAAHHGPGCGASPPVPFSAAAGARFACAPDLPRTGRPNEWSGTALTACPLPTGPASAVPVRSITDACPPGRVPEDGFADVPMTGVHESAVDCVTWWRIASGSGGAYEPDRVVTRDQLATFLVRLLERTGASLPASAPDRFPDDEGSVHEASIDRLAAAGVVAGRPDGGFDPGEPVTRGQAATFLVRALELRLRAPLPLTGDAFVDDVGSPHEAATNRAATAGLVAGTGDRRYDPFTAVPRDQMATLLARSLDLLVDRGVTRPPG